MATDENAAADDPAQPTTDTAEPTDDLVTTHHTVTVGKRKLNYTATTGRMVLRQEDVTDGRSGGHKPKAEVFVTAYTLDDADAATRPVTFAFNGGPGSASAWLHLGLLGPRRAVSGDTGAIEPPPYGLVDNQETLLTESDLVFIDPVSTGYSRVLSGQKPSEFHGFGSDIESVAELIRLWTSRNGRWLSPKFVAGESYGTIRAAGLAEHMQSKLGLYLNGVMLLSSVLNLGTVFFSEGNDVPYALYLPTYAAIAHYHGLHGSRPLSEVLAEAEEFAANDYLVALAKGNRLTAEERAGIVERVAALTGLSEDFVDRVNLRVEHIRFFTELLRDRRLVVGRLDSRFTGPEQDYGREHMSSDPASNAIMGAFAAALNHHVRVNLGYENDLPYQVLSGAVNEEWSYKEFENSHVTVADKLATAMRVNEHLKVHVAFGYHDGATPYFAAEHVLAHLDIPRERHEDIDRAYYEAGHMMYIHEPSRIKQADDLRRFVRDSSNR